MADSKNKPSRLISNEDKETLRGWENIYRPEPDQIYPVHIPETSDIKTPSQRLKQTRVNADDLLNKINELQNKIDQRCSHLSISTSETVGSPLFQAMVRVFNKRTTNIKYEDYKRALELRQQLIEEDKQELKKT